MKILQVNLCNCGSTGEIAYGINEVANSRGMDTYFAYPWDEGVKPRAKRDIAIGTKYGRKISRRLGMITGFNGCFSIFATLRFLLILNELKPDIIHLHNLHNCYVNLPLLFGYIKKHKIHTVWTLHDCWAFTGQCPHFTIIKCDKWRNGCHNCQQYNKIYPEMYIDQTKIMWNLKRKWFTGVENLTIVTPSRWLSELVKQSFLKMYPIKVINNGIDLSVFKPTLGDFRERFHIKKKWIVLGVSFGWDNRKGLDVFIYLSKHLGKDYQVVLVGTNEKIDVVLPDTIISIHRTHNRQELAEIYTAADVFVNPTREDNYPTVNMEALACGTPVITFITGGSPEVIDSTCGFAVPYNDVTIMENAIIDACEKKQFSTENCLNRAESFDKNIKYEEYLSLYESME